MAISCYFLPTAMVIRQGLGCRGLEGWPPPAQVRRMKTQNRGGKQEGTLLEARLEGRIPLPRRNPWRTFVRAETPLRDHSLSKTHTRAETPEGLQAMGDSCQRMWPIGDTSRGRNTLWDARPWRTHAGAETPLRDCTTCNPCWGREIPEGP